MEILKSVSILAICAMLNWASVFAQDQKALQTAFSTSYTQEYSGNYTKAIDALKAVYDEKSYEINLRLGWLNYMAGLFTESMAYYQKAINLKPVSIEAKFGYVYPAAALGNWEVVTKQYKDVLSIDPNNTLANYRLGLIAYGKEDYNSAFKYFEKIVNLYPFDYDSLIMFAWTNLRKGMNREAKVLFQKALLIKPDDASALEGLGMIK